LLELLELIGDLQGKPPQIDFDAWRPADQQYYVSDTRKFAAATGWSPKVSVREGVSRLHQWLVESRAPAAAPILSMTEVIADRNGHTHEPVSVGAQGHILTKRKSKIKKLFGNGAVSRRRA